MTIQSRETALERAREKKTNVVGTCQMITRGYYDAPSAGNQDGDRDADAVDGWLSEPAWAKHSGDRKPPPGVPLYFRNADGTGHGHRAISETDFRVRSSDFNGQTKRYDEGVMGTGSIEDIERAMSLVYVGWSDTITGFKIPFTPPKKPIPAAVDDGTEVGNARDHMRVVRARARQAGFKKRERAADKIVSAINNLPKGE